MKKFNSLLTLKSAMLVLFAIVLSINLKAQNIVSGPGKLLFKTGQGLNEHGQVVAASELGNKDVWQFEEVENGYVILKCPSRGYLVAGIGHNNVFNLGYHQYAKTATRFKPQTKANGYKTYEWVSSNPLHKDHYLGNWRNNLVLKKGGSNAAHLKIVD